MRTVVVAVLAVALHAQDRPGFAELKELHERHARIVCGQDRRPPVNLRFAGEMVSSGRRATMRVFVRAEPFACRRELQQVDPPGPVTVMITDGRHAWAEGTGPLPDEAARMCFDLAFVDGLLYLDPATIRGGPDTRAPWDMPAHEGVPPDLAKGLRTRWLALQAPGGTMLQFHFGADDDRLHEVSSADTPGAVQWSRFGEWETRSGITLPMLRAYGTLGVQQVNVLRVTEFEVGSAMPDALFAGSPRQAVPRVQRAGRLQVVAHTLPGEVHLVLPEVEVNGYAVIAMLDTGARWLAIEPELANRLRLPQRGPLRMAALTSMVDTPSVWIDRLATGDRTLLQLVAAAVTLPPIVQMPFDRQSGVLFGLDALADSPVLDLAGGELLFRGAPVTPLADLGAGTARVLTHRLARDAAGHLSASLVVNGVPLDAIVDSGAPGLLHLSRAAAEQCGLPLDPEVWLARGAMAFHVGEAGGGKTRDLIVRLPELRLGPVRFREPFVHLAGLDAGARAPKYHALLGAGAMQPFARVGLDFERGLLELDPGERRFAGDVLEIEAPGPLLGFSLVSPPSAAPGGLLALPMVVNVQPGTVAARAGLVDGELVRRIGGRSCAGLGTEKFNRSLWLRPDEHVELEVLGKDGKLRTLRLP